MITPFNKKDIYFVVGGLVIYHLLVAGLCIFWIYRFIIQTYDPDVIFLLVLFLGGTILCDVLIARVQGFARFLVRCKVDSWGIHCVRIGGKRWSILWEDIHVFGISGFSSPANMGIMFFSTDIHETYSKAHCVSISYSRIVFQANEDIWSKINVHVPVNIRTKLRKSMDEQRDCFYKI